MYNISYAIRKSPTGKLWMTVGDRWQYTQTDPRQKLTPQVYALPCVGFTDCLFSWQHNRWCEFPNKEETV
jgi:hypothetical protein